MTPQHHKALVSSHYMKNETHKEENPNEIANKILNEYLEGKSFGFIKSVLKYIDGQLDIICIVPNATEKM